MRLRSRLRFTCPELSDSAFLYREPCPDPWVCRVYVRRTRRLPGSTPAADHNPHAPAVVFVHLNGCRFSVIAAPPCFLQLCLMTSQRSLWLTTTLVRAKSC